MSRRRVRPEELELWQQVARTAQRIRPEDFQIGQKAAGAPPAHDVLPGLSERVAKAPVQMDKKAFHRMKRGKLIPEAKIDLRHNVPQWLRMPPLASLVLQITEAHLKHGGGGAYYVYLRRQR